MMPDTVIPAAPGADRPPPVVRRRDGPATRRAILEAALVEFSDKGLSGARVDAIAARAGTNVRMIYYYFSSKDGLYRGVLAQGYADVRAAEQTLRLDALPPRDAVAALCRFMFDYHDANPRFSRLVSIENIHHAVHLSRCDSIEGVNQPILLALEGILAKGRAAGLFRDDAAPLAVHLLMTSYCFFRVANRHTLRAVFGADTLPPAGREAERLMLTDAVLGYLRRGEP